MNIHSTEIRKDLKDLTENEFDEYTVIFIKPEDDDDDTELLKKIKTMRMSNAPAALQVASEKISQGHHAYVYDPQGVLLQ